MLTLTSFYLAALAVPLLSENGYQYVYMVYAFSFIATTLMLIHPCMSIMFLHSNISLHFQISNLLFMFPNANSSTSVVLSEHNYKTSASIMLFMSFQYTRSCSARLRWRTVPTLNGSTDHTWGLPRKDDFSRLTDTWFLIIKKKSKQKRLCLLCIVLRWRNLVGKVCNIFEWNMMVWSG